MTAPDVGLAPDAWIGPYLVTAGLVPEDRLAVLASVKGVSLWRSVVDTGLATDAAICAALASHFRLPVAAIGAADPRAVTVLPESAARKYHVVALALDEKSVRIATCDPRDFAAEQDLGFLTGRDVKLEVASPSAISEKLDELYRPENSINRLLQGLTPTQVEVQVSDAPEDRDPALDAPMTKLVDAMISDAVQAGASDIHSEIEGANVIVRYRVDGILREVMRLPEAAGASLVRRVKIIAGLDVTNSMTPQDGRSSLKVGGQLVDMRVATAPVARRGEKLVIRILNKSNLRASIPALALPPEEESVLMRMLSHREGMLLVTGPTGSGKTTTLYAVLNHLKTGKVNIVTVEDPVEYDVDGISQMQVNEAQGFTFATALRSVLRQDPDIVLVGEIRDGETATIAIQAGLTGHLVFSTLHTNDAVSALVRLRDMGIDSFKLGTVLRGVVAQRLVRRVCPQCAVDVPLDDIPPLARPPADYAGPCTPKRGAGCKSCGGSGYKGRIAVMEMLPVEGAVGGLIESGAPQQAILDASRPHGMRTLWESGLIRFWGGLTTYEEIHRVLGESQEARHPGDQHRRRCGRGTGGTRSLRRVVGRRGHRGRRRQGRDDPARRRRCPDAPARAHRPRARGLHRDRGRRWPGYAHRDRDAPDRLDPARPRHAAADGTRRPRGTARLRRHCRAASDHADGPNRRHRIPGARVGCPGLPDQAGAATLTGRACARRAQAHQDGVITR